MKRQDVVTETNRLITLHDELTVRQIYYALYVKGFYKDFSSAKSFYNSFDKMLVHARERGEVDDTKILDTGRQAYGGDFGFATVEEYINHCLNKFLNKSNGYTRRRWDTQTLTPIIWIEKDALARVVMRVADEYRVQVCPSRGYTSYTYLKERIQKNNIMILHFADHDPSGLDMTRDLRKRAKQYAGHDVLVKRIGLNIEQVKAYDLTPNPTKTSSRVKRYVAQYGDRCWELDALPPDVLRAMVRSSIEECIDVNVWNVQIEEEKPEYERVQKLFEGFEDVLCDVWFGR